MIRYSLGENKQSGSIGHFFTSSLTSIFSLAGKTLFALAFSLSILNAQDDAAISNEGNNAAGGSNPEAKEWPSDFSLKLRNDIRDGAYDIRMDLAASIFDSITDQTVFSYGDDRHLVEINVKRDIYANHDIMDSYSVVDSLKIPYKFYFINMPSIPVGPVSFGVRASTQVQLNFLNIRQVFPKDLKNIPRPQSPSTAEFTKELAAESKKLFIPGKESVDEDRVLYDSANDPKESLGKKLKKFFTADFSRPEAKARWSKFWNIFLHPFDLPITEKNFKKMDMGEIFSYGLGGVVQLDTEVAFAVSALPGFDSFNIGVSSSVYFKGDFRVSLLKEDQKHILLKLNRVTTKGASLAFGAHEDLILFEGFTVLGSKNGQISDSIIPFEFLVSKSYSQSFDTAYRFDLSNPLALEAYGDALLGNMKTAHKLSKEANSGVKWVFDRQQMETSSGKQHRMKLSLLFERAHSTAGKQAVMVITDQEGTHHIFKSNTQTTRSWDTLWGAKESKSFGFKFLADRAKYYTTDQGASLTFSGSIIDTHTTFKELNRYILQVAEDSGQTEIFPKLTRDYPKQLCLKTTGSKSIKEKLKCEKIKPTKLGASQFFYKIAIKQDAMKQFMNIPADRHWSILEKAFKMKQGIWSTQAKRTLFKVINAPLSALNLPLALADVKILRASKIYHAERFQKGWRSLKYARSLEEISILYRQLLTTSDFSREFLRAIKLATPNFLFEFYIDAKNDLTFGRLSRSGNMGALDDKEFERRMAFVDFENPSGRIEVDQISAINAIRLEQTKPNEIVITFELPEVPKYLFISVERANLFKTYKRLAAILMVNKPDGSRFVKGLNTLKLNKQSTNPLEIVLAKYFFEGGSFNLKMAMMKEGRSWGPMSITRQSFEKPAKSESPKK